MQIHGKLDVKEHLITTGNRRRDLLASLRPFHLVVDGVGFQKRIVNFKTFLLDMIDQ